MDKNTQIIYNKSLYYDVTDRRAKAKKAVWWQNHEQLTVNKSHIKPPCYVDKIEQIS